MNTKVIKISGNYTIYIELLLNSTSIESSKRLDDLVFQNHAGISMNEIEQIANQKGLLGI